MAFGEKGHYDAEVNKGDLNMNSFTRKLNDRHEEGWKLAHVFEHGGNMVIVWERQ